MPASARTVRSFHVVPPPSLAPDVDRVWSYDAPADHPLPTLLPGTGAELIFQDRPALGVIGETGHVMPLPRAFVFCLRSASASLVALAPVRFVSVRLRSGRLRHFSPARPEELADRFCPTLEGLGPVADALAEDLGSLPGLAAKSRRLFEYLLRHRSAQNPGERVEDPLLDALYYTDASVSIAALADETGFSVRQLERHVRHASGLSPKQFRRVARFHHTMRRLHLGGTADYLPVALEHGYHDQAHFIHECRALTGLTPGQLLHPGRRASHFYNTSLRSAATMAGNHTHHGIHHRHTEGPSGPGIQA